MGQMYFVITNSEGDTRVVELSKAELEKRLNEKYWGERDVRFAESVPKESDTNYWGGVVLIIRGSVVVPNEVSTVTKFEVP